MTAVLRMAASLMSFKAFALLSAAFRALRPAKISPTMLFAPELVPSTGNAREGRGCRHASPTLQSSRRLYRRANHPRLRLFSNCFVSQPLALCALKRNLRTHGVVDAKPLAGVLPKVEDRKSTRLNSS